MRQHTVFASVLGVWIVLGLVADEVFHIHNKEEAFWTTSHIIIYSGIIAIIVRIVWILLQNRRTGETLSRGIGVLTVIVLLSGGIGDTILHLVYNVQDEALWSRPTHLLILLGGLLFPICSTNRN